MLDDTSYGLHTFCVTCLYTNFRRQVQGRDCTVVPRGRGHFFEGKCRGENCTVVPRDRGRD